MDETRNGAPGAGDYTATSILEARLRVLSIENERLKLEVEQLKLERDEYLKALYKLAPEYMFTKEEIDEMIANQGSGRAFMDEIKKSLTEAS